MGYWFRYFSGYVAKTNILVLQKIFIDILGYFFTSQNIPRYSKISNKANLQMGILQLASIQTTFQVYIILLADFRFHGTILGDAALFTKTCENNVFSLSTTFWQPICLFWVSLNHFWRFCVLYKTGQLHVSPSGSNLNLASVTASLNNPVSTIGSSEC